MSQGSSVVNVLLVPVFSVLPGLNVALQELHISHDHPKVGPVTSQESDQFAYCLLPNVDTSQLVTAKELGTGATGADEVLKLPTAHADVTPERV
jgi:hypothetical protein